jgi:hypothetical protein
VGTPKIAAVGEFDTQCPWQLVIAELAASVIFDIPLYRAQ